jgi:AcrR family transcriptional regulator
MNTKRKEKPSNQELRTRKDLLLAAGRLMKEGRRPSMDEVAEEALVSRATVYRYFRNIEALLAEVPVDAFVGDPAAIFENDTTADPETRIDTAEAFIHEAIYHNEAQLRILLANSIGRDLTDDTFPRRQNRREPLIDSALATARHRFRDDVYDKLRAALALIVGPESMIVFRDVLHLDKDTARAVKSWAVRALVRAALTASEAGPTSWTRDHSGADP